MATARSVKQTFIALEVSEGQGMRVRRAIPSPDLPNLTPFIISLIISGAINHEDFLGNKGTIGPGGIQVMTAGRGIMHSEQTKRADPKLDPPDSIVEAIQLWVDLPHNLRYTAPGYLGIKASKIPVLKIDGGRVTVRIIAGESHGKKAKYNLTHAPMWYFDISMKPGGRIQQIIQKGWNAFLYTLHGNIFVDGAPRIGKFCTVEFGGEGDYVEVFVPDNEEEGARFILLAGMPLDQKIVHYGPFVLSDEDEVRKAISDFRLGMNGFERALTWESDISKSLGH
ncbi:hypothetical protein B7463_g4591, partial [Scytalidium lignicola]